MAASWVSYVDCSSFSFIQSLIHLFVLCFIESVTVLFLLGSGSGLAMLSTNIIIHQRFTRNRNLASGIGWLGFSCGGIIGSILDKSPYPVVWLARCLPHPWSHSSPTHSTLPVLPHTKEINLTVKACVRNQPTKNIWSDDSEISERNL